MDPFGLFCPTCMQKKMSNKILYFRFSHTKKNVFISRSPAPGNTFFLAIVIIFIGREFAFTRFVVCKKLYDYHHRMVVYDDCIIEHKQYRTSSPFGRNNR